MYLERMRLDGKVGLVVGAGGGRMGTESAVALAEAGATVAGIDVSEERLETARERVTEIEGTFLPLVADALDARAVSSALDRAWSELGPVEHLVHVVGGSRPENWRTLDEYSDELFDRVIDFNLRSTFLSCRAVATKLIEAGRGGTIVTFTSLSGLHGAPLHGAYAAAKAGVVSLTRTMALEWGRHGIRVNSIAPGRTLTFRNAQANTDTDPGNPMGRYAELSEIAAAVLFFTAGLSSGITGQTLAVDTGDDARSPMGPLEYWEDIATRMEAAGR
jgi:NAD(P)-dependent dehydrogenase (short-subunit alcohol dehydrogenase family)